MSSRSVFVFVPCLFVNLVRSLVRSFVSTGERRKGGMGTSAYPQRLGRFGQRATAVRPEENREALGEGASVATEPLLAHPDRGRSRHGRRHQPGQSAFPFIFTHLVPTNCNGV